LIKILIVNFYYDLIILAVLCSNFIKERRIYKHVWTYFVYNYIYVSGIAMCFNFFVSFFDSCFLKFKNALKNEKTAKLVFIFKYMRARVHLRE